MYNSFVTQMHASSSFEIIQYLDPFDLGCMSRPSMQSVDSVDIFFFS